MTKRKAIDGTEEEKNGDNDANMDDHHGGSNGNNESENNNGGAAVAQDSMESKKRKSSALKTDEKFNKRQKTGVTVTTIKRDSDSDAQSTQDDEEMDQSAPLPSSSDKANSAIKDNDDEIGSNNKERNDDKVDMDMSAAGVARAPQEGLGTSQETAQQKQVPPPKDFTAASNNNDDIASPQPATQQGDASKRIPTIKKMRLPSQQTPHPENQSHILGRPNVLGNIATINNDDGNSGLSRRLRFDNEQQQQQQQQPPQPILGRPTTNEPVVLQSRTEFTVATSNIHQESSANYYGNGDYNINQDDQNLSFAQQLFSWVRGIIYNDSDESGDSDLYRDTPRKSFIATPFFWFCLLFILQGVFFQFWVNPILSTTVDMSKVLLITYKSIGQNNQNQPATVIIPTTINETTDISTNEVEESHVANVAEETEEDPNNGQLLKVDSEESNSEEEEDDDDDDDGDGDDDDDGTGIQELELDEIEEEPFELSEEVKGVLSELSTLKSICVSSFEDNKEIASDITKSTISLSKLLEEQEKSLLLLSQKLQDAQELLSNVVNNPDASSSESFEAVRVVATDLGRTVIDTSTIELWTVEEPSSCGGPVKPAYPLSEIVLIEDLEKRLDDIQIDAQESASEVIKSPDFADKINEWAKKHIQMETGGGLESIIAKRPIPETFERSGLSWDDVHQIIYSRVESERADGTGEIDHASILYGAKIVRQGRRRTSRSLVDSLPILNRLLHFSSLRFYGHGPEAAITPTYPPDALGQCWAFEQQSIAEQIKFRSLGYDKDIGSKRGNYGTLTIELPYPVEVDNVMIEHPPKRLTKQVHSAIRDFRIIGYEDPAADGKSWSLGSFQYDINNEDPMQEFEVATDIFGTPVPPLRAITLAIDSNWGFQYTCLYRFRVHGERTEIVEERTYNGFVL